MLEEKYLSILGATSPARLLEEMVRFSEQLGFTSVSATAVLDRLGGEAEFFSVEKMPEAYLARYNDAEMGRRDPVSQHCKLSNTPIVWGQSTYVRAGMGEMWEYQAQHGLRMGVSWALHLPGGRHFLLGLDRNDDFPADKAEVSRIVAAVQLFAVHAVEGALRLLIPSPAPSPVQLSARELEVLRWTMEGKTAWEVGRILGIAEDTVVRHTQSASHKLGCSSKHHAVVKALRLGLIH